MKYKHLFPKILKILENHESEDSRIPKGKAQQGFMSETEISKILKEEYDLGYSNYQPMVNKTCRRMEKEGKIIIEKVSSGPGPLGINIVRER